jgi:AhpC/TSA antioxidant enzyme
MAVGMGDAVEARAIVQHYAPNIMCMIDQNQQAYQQFGLGRAGLGAFFAPQVAIEAVKITREGYAAGAPIGGDVMQMPGTFVVDRTGHFTLAYYSRNIADHPRDDVLHAALLG